MSKFFKDLKEGLEEIIAHKEGKLNLRTEFIEIPAPPTEYKAKDIKKIRERKNYSQGYFSKILGVSVRTLQSWESGKRHPGPSALRLLEIIDQGLYPKNIK
jgi:putative transcriptional regulator